MSEKPESDDFEEEDAEDVAPGGDEVDVDHIMRDVESQRRRAPKGAEPAWRRSLADRIGAAQGRLFNVGDATARLQQLLQVDDIRAM